MRETQPWAEWELALLEVWHPLKGTAHVQALLAKRGVQRSDYSIRHKASRLGLSHGLKELTPLPQVAREAGVTGQAVRNWVRRKGLGKHCPKRGGVRHLPAPVVQLYLHEHRVSGRPTGWWGINRAAAEAGVHPTTLVRHVDYVTFAGVKFFDPILTRLYGEQVRRAATPPPRHVRLRDLAPPGRRQTQAHEWFKANASPARYGKGRKAPLYVHEDAARAFLTARGHHAEQVETLLRRALVMQASGVKDPE